MSELSIPHCMYSEISIVYPAYNEEKNIIPTIQRSYDALTSQFKKFELIVVNDASTDNTPLILEELAKFLPELVIIHNKQNIGAGESMLKGMKAARFSLVVNNAMDYPFDLNDLCKMTPLLEENDIVVASRNSRPGYSRYRTIISKVNIWLIRLLFGIDLKDFNFVQIYKKGVIDSITVNSTSAGFIPAEMIIKAFDKGYTISDININYYPRVAGVSVMGKPNVIINSLKDMVSFWFERNYERRLI